MNASYHLIKSPVNDSWHIVRYKEDSCEIVDSFHSYWAALKKLNLYKYISKKVEKEVKTLCSTCLN